MRECAAEAHACKLHLHTHLTPHRCVQPLTPEHYSISRNKPALCPLMDVRWRPLRVSVQG